LPEGSFPGKSFLKNEGDLIMKDYFGRDASSLKDKRLFLFDMDGTVNQDERLFDGALDLMRNIRALGGEYVFITNNSTWSVEDLMGRMTRLGIPTTPDNYFTATMATVLYLRKNYPGAKIYCQGTRSSVRELRQAGLDITEEVTSEAKVILVCYDAELTYPKLRRTCEMLSTYRDTPFVATNPDLCCPASFGFVPDCGSICQMLENATGRRPLYVGKPEPTMVYEAERKFGRTTDETVVIGDRLYTDIAVGLNAGTATVAVLTGEATAESIVEGDIKPMFTFESVKEMNEALMG